MSLDKVLGSIIRSLSRHDKAIGDIGRSIVREPLNAGRASRFAIASGVITVTRPHVLVTPESGTTDNLDVINNFTDGKFVIVAPADAGDTITVRDYTVSAGNIDLRGGSAILSAQNQSVLLYYVDETARWHLVVSPTSGGAVVSVNGQTGVVLLDSDDIAEGATNLYFTTAEEAKLAGIAVGAEVNVNADWDAVTGDALILNKPSSFPPGAHASSHQHGGADEVATSTPAADAIVKALGTGKIDNAWLDATLASLATLGTAADRIAYTTGVDTWAETPLTPFTRTILDDATQGAVQITLALVPGTNIQAFHANLAALSGLTGAADSGFYFTGAGAMALYTLTAYGRTLAALADAAALRTSAGLVAGGAGDIWVEKAGDTMSGALNMGSQLITSLATPVSAGDAVTKAYVDAIAEGLDIKASVRAATTVNITLSGAQTIDGVSVISGDRVLVKNQTAPAENGIYVVAAGAWARSADANVSAEVTSGMFAFVTEGTVAGNTGWALTTDDPIVLATTSLTFSQFSGPTNIAAAIDNASETTTPVDANKFALVVAGVLTWVNWAKIKDTLKVYTDTLYELAGAIATHAALTVTHGATGAVAGTTNTQTFTNKTHTAPIITGTLLHNSGVANENYREDVLTIGDMLASQVLTIDVLHAVNGRAFITNFDISLGHASSVTVNALIKGWVMWFGNTGTASVQITDMTFTAQLASCTITEITGGFRITATRTATVGTMSQNMARFEHTGYASQNTTYLVTVT